MKQAQRKMRKFHKAAVKGKPAFLSASKTWLLTLFRMANPQPDPDSKRYQLPRFAADPPWQPGEAMNRLSNMLQAGRNISDEPFSWYAFWRALWQPKSKAPGAHQVAPHLHQLLLLGIYRPSRTRDLGWAPTNSAASCMMVLAPSMGCRWLLWLGGLLFNH